MFDALLLSAMSISLLAGQFARIELINSLANVYVHEFLLLIYVVKLILQYTFFPLRQALHKRPFLLLVIIFVASFGISIGEFTLLQNGIALLYLLRISLYILFGVYLFHHVKQKKTLTVFLFNLIYTLSILLLIITVIQYIFFPNFWGLYAFGWDPHLYRASGVYFDVFIAAALYGVLLFFWISKKNRVLSILFLIALVLTFSRSAYVALVIALFYFFLSQRKWKELAISLCLFAVLILGAPKPFGEGVNLLRTSSINSRILDFQLGLRIWQEKPFLGFGYNRIRFAKEQLHVAPVDDKSHSLSSFHSSFLIILVTTGVCGLFSLIILIFVFLKRHPYARVYAVYILIMSLFDNVLLHVLVILPLIIIGTYLDQSVE